MQVVKKKILTALIILGALALAAAVSLLAYNLLLNIGAPVPGTGEPSEDIGDISAYIHNNATEVRVPILMYHHFADDDLGHPGMVASGEQFASHLRALRDAGFTTISFNDLAAFVYDGAPLPERPVIITIDDGYLSTYEVAFPILKQYDMNATVFIIGVTHGMVYYKDTGHVLRWPRFNDEQALTMAASGHIFIESHSYDMHQHEPWELPENFRRGVLRKESESEEEYIKAFRYDFERSAAQIEALLGARPIVFSYPFGISNELSDGLLREMGVKATLKITQGVNIVSAGDPYSLMSMHRFNVPWDTAPEELLELILAS